MPVWFDIRPRHPSAGRTVAPLAVAVLASTPLIFAPASAQEPIDHAMIQRITAEGMDRSQAPEVFGHLVDVIGPRLAGTPAYNRAAEWTRDWLTARGIADARLDPFDFQRGWTLEKLSAEMTAPRYLPLVAYSEAWSPSTRGVLQGRPVYVGDLSEARIRGMADRIRGAIVLTHRPQTVFTRADRPQPTMFEEAVRTGAPERAPGEMGDLPMRPQEMAELLRELGAGVRLAPTRGEFGTVYVLGNRNAPDDAVPSLVLAAEQYNLLVRLAQAGEPVELRVESRTRYHDDPVSYNVLAEIPGTDPVLKDEVVLLGAHLDSWHSAGGAADNADGVAVAMEAMRILKALDARPRRTIRIALWGAEEQGLIGSRAYVEKYLSGPENAAAHAAHSVYFNDDPGSGPTYGWYMEGNHAAKEIFDAWLEPLKPLGATRNVILGLPSTDHLSFTRVGIPGFSMIKNYENYDTRMHHTNADLHERIRPDDLKQASVVLAVFAWHAAQRDERIPRMAVP